MLRPPFAPPGTPCASGRNKLRPSRMESRHLGGLLGQRASRPLPHRLYPASCGCLARSAYQSQSPASPSGTCPRTTAHPKGLQKIIHNARPSIENFPKLTVKRYVWKNFRTFLRNVSRLKIHGNKWNGLSVFLISNWNITGYTKMAFWNFGLSKWEWTCGSLPRHVSPPFSWWR